ncbi:MAG: hypothetical protein KGL39_54320 [Patescibacteria group bacterium]|nr:hypothetical protein [Patescibacteria group bacterium]
MSNTNAGARTYITAVSGAGPYTLTVAPALPQVPANGDTNATDTSTGGMLVIHWAVLP